MSANVFIYPNGSRLLLQEQAVDINPFRGATKEDVISTSRQLELAGQLYRSVVTELLTALAANMHTNAAAVYAAARQTCEVVGEQEREVMAILSNAEDDVSC